MINEILGVAVKFTRYAYVKRLDSRRFGLLDGAAMESKRLELHLRRIGQDCRRQQIFLKLFLQRLTDERLSDVEYGFRIIVSVRKNSVSISDVSPTELSQILNVQSIPTRTTLGSYHQISETPRSQTRNIRTTDMHCQGPRCGKCLGSHSDERDEDEEFHPPVQLLEGEEPDNTMSQNKSACLE
ncbi:hypothetical protein GW17_00060810 [Ensete ventricosum]|nr:hypothetical protein GW17_00060810 [Ensete ventricosum]